MTGKKHIRLVLPDVLKGLAVLLMIQVHVMEQFIQPELMDTFFGKISLFLGAVPAAPVFMIAMGYFIGFTKAGTGKMIKRGIVLFTGGILLNAFLNLSYIIKFIRTGHAEMIPGSVLGADILPLAGLSLVIIALLIRLSSSPYLLFALALLVAAATPLANNLADSWHSIRYVSVFFAGTAEWSYFPLFPWLSYPLAGLALYYAGHNKWHDLNQRMKSVILIVAGAGFATGLKMGFNISSNLELYYHHSLLFFLWALAFVILIVFLLSLFNPESKPMRFALLSFFGREVTLIYIIQWILIGNFAAWTGQRFGIPGYFAWTTGLVLGSATLAWLYRKVSGKIHD